MYTYDQNGNKIRAETKEHYQPAKSSNTASNPSASKNAMWVWIIVAVVIVACLVVLFLWLRSGSSSSTTSMAMRRAKMGAQRWGFRFY